MKNLPIHIKFILIGTIVAIVSSLLITPSVRFYNSTKNYKFQLSEIEERQITNYDGYYQMFVDKTSNAQINKETFIEVTNIIMEARKDGQSLAWKWNVENQNIPYGEFTWFYKELSLFINERYKDNMIIESQKQSIVNQHNLLLETFPNNIYNYFIRIKPLKYNQGFVSEITKNKFK